MAKGQRAYCTATDHPANTHDAETYCETFHYVGLTPEQIVAAAERARPAIRTYHSDALGAVTIPED